MNLFDILKTPWAIPENCLLDIAGLYQIQLRNGVPDLEAFFAAIGHKTSDQDAYDMAGDVAIIPVRGTLLKDSRYSASYTQITAAFRQAQADPSVAKIVLHIDSPGGTVLGVKELADEIFVARGNKPVAAFSDGQMTSAAYFIAAAADRVYISSENVISGSIGVRTIHIDASKFYEDYGLKVTDLYAGKYKNVGSQNKPLSPEDKDVIQAELDYFYTTFVNSIALYRGVSAEQVQKDMADARIFIGRQAVEAGLVDGVVTLAQLFSNSQHQSLGTGAVSAGPAQTEETVMKLTLDQLKLENSELYEQIQADARKGMLLQADADTATATAVTEEGKRLVALHTAVYGEDAGKKFGAIVEAGISAEQATALGITAAADTTDLSTRQEMLDNIESSAAEPVGTTKTATGEQAEEAAVVAAMVEGAGSRT